MRLFDVANRVEMRTRFARSARLDDESGQDESPLPHAAA